MISISIKTVDSNGESCVNPNCPCHPKYTKLSKVFRNPNLPKGQAYAIVQMGDKTETYCCLCIGNICYQLQLDLEANNVQIQQ